MSFISELGQGILAVIKSPFLDLTALWVLGPILLLWVVLVVYFDKYKKEKLGWNTALGNGISMFWISVMLMRHVFEQGLDQSFAALKIISLGLVIIYALFISIISFKHSLSSNTVFLLASPTPIYFFSAAAVVVAYDALTLNLYTIIGLVIVFIGILVLNLIIGHFVPEDPKDTTNDPDSTPERKSFIDRPQNNKFRPVPNTYNPRANYQPMHQQLRRPNQQRPMTLEDVKI